jgi:predicted PurR-regulated permease PerM
VFWWIYVSVLAAAALFIAHAFVGVLALGLFGYYAIRPIANRFGMVIESKRIAAGLTALTVLVPVLVLTIYAVIRMFQQIQQRVDENVISIVVSYIFDIDLGEGGLISLLRNPPSLYQLIDQLSGSAVQQGLEVLNILFGTVLLLALAVTLSYALLVYDEAISDAFAELVGGRGETVYSYALAVDTDLESIFFGNFLFVIVMSFMAIATYAITNLVAPAGMQIPMVFTLGILTGITSLIPIVVSKVVYIPVVAYLAVTATDGGNGQFVFVGSVLVVYFLVLDIIPQSLIQPYISGRQLNPMILLFAYILGPILFGWYGFFLMPIVFVLMLEAARIILPELLHGDPIEPEPGLAEETGASPEEMQEDETDDATSDDETETDQK